MRMLLALTLSGLFLFACTDEVDAPSDQVERTPEQGPELQTKVWGDPHENVDGITAPAATEKQKVQHWGDPHVDEKDGT